MIHAPNSMNHSHHVFKVGTVVGGHVGSERFKVTGGAPFQVKLVHVLRVLGADQLRDKLELLTKAQYALLKDGDFLRRPLLKHKSGGHRIDQDIEVSFLVEVTDGVEVKLKGLLLLFRVCLVDLIL